MERTDDGRVKDDGVAKLWRVRLAGPDAFTIRRAGDLNRPCFYVGIPTMMDEAAGRLRRIAVTAQLAQFLNGLGRPDWIDTLQEHQSFANIAEITGFEGCKITARGPMVPRPGGRKGEKVQLDDDVSIPERTYMVYCLVKGTVPK